MAPLPNNDDKTSQDKEKDEIKDLPKDEKTLSNLNDRELKALLDEAINYKNPKDREGKSELFNDLLLEAEETERIARATSAGGSELVRHCNSAARRQRHNLGLKGRRYGGPGSSGMMGRNVSERGTHGGSLDNLVKDELYETSCIRRLRGGRKSSTSSSGASSNYGGNQVRVSARQREGGSLPCNVNSGQTSRDFLEEAKHQKEMKDKEYNDLDMEKERLIDKDFLARGYEERLIDGGGPSKNSTNSNETHISTVTPKYTSKATLQIQSNRASNVDDPIPLDLDNASGDNNNRNLQHSQLTKVVNKSSCLLIPQLKTTTGLESNFSYFQKVDENGNALQQQQTKEKKKKKQSDKNVKILKSENIEGHKSEIIDKIDKLLQFIEGTDDNKGRTVQKSKLHKQHTEDGGSSRTNKKKQAKSKENHDTSEGRPELKKSNSLSEISGMKLDREFEAFNNKNNKQDREEENVVVLRSRKSGIDRSRERRSWGTVESHSFQPLYNATSLENLESSSDNWEVTRPKKKSKKRRNSASSASGARQNSSNSGVSSCVSNEERRGRRAASPDLGVVIVGVPKAKITRSMPHSEKSNDSSDVDSVHSLPMDGPISYADIAKNSEKKKLSPEKLDRSSSSSSSSTTTVTVYNTKEKSSVKSIETPSLTPSIITPVITHLLEKTRTNISPTTTSTPFTHKIIVPDVHNIKSFPTITGTTIIKSSSVQLLNNIAEKTVQLTNLSGEVVLQKSESNNNNNNNKRQLTTPTNNNNSNPITIKERKIFKSVGKDFHPTSNPTHVVQGFFQSGGDVQNELSLMNKDASSYINHRMPPDILDVSTIEKIQFLNCSNVNLADQQLISSTTLNENQNISSSNGKGKRKKPSKSFSNHHLLNETNKMDNLQETSSSSSSSSSSSESPSIVCDTSNSLNEGVGGKIVYNGVSNDSLILSSEFHEEEMLQSSSNNNSSPPVVIISGISKDVPSGLVFGFDINEQLLLEDNIIDNDDGDDYGQQPNNNLVNSNINNNEQDVSENNSLNDVNDICRGDEWVKRYKAPPQNDRIKHNHDKIVYFISHAWETIRNEQVQYYTDSL